MTGEPDPGSQTTAAARKAADRERMAKVRAARKPGPRAPVGPPAATPFQAPTEFAGMTARECCDGCQPDHCVISGGAICAHPMKSPLQSAFLVKPDVVKRYARAKAALAHQKIDLTV